MDDEKRKQLERLVCVPTLVSDGTLRSAIANLMGWRIDSSYYSDRGRPWAADYYADRCHALEKEIEELRGD